MSTLISGTKVCFCLFMIKKPICECHSIEYLKDKQEQYQS